MDTFPMDTLLLDAQTPFCWMLQRQRWRQQWRRKNCIGCPLLLRVAIVVIIVKKYWTNALPMTTTTWFHRCSCCCCRCHCHCQCRCFSNNSGGNSNDGNNKRNGNKIASAMMTTKMTTKNKIASWQRTKSHCRCWMLLLLLLQMMPFCWKNNE